MVGTQDAVAFLTIGRDGYGLCPADLKADRMAIGGSLVRTAVHIEPGVEISVSDRRFKLRQAGD